MKNEDKFKPYVYKVYNRNGKLEEYSGYFSTKEEAINNFKGGMIIQVS